MDIYDFTQYPPSEDHATALITAGFENILYYDGPVLFAGRNEAGDRIVGSLLEWNDERKIVWYLHGVMSESDFWAYRRKETTYPDALRRSRCFALGFGDNDKPPMLHSLTYDELPASYKVDEDALFPHDSPEECFEDRLGHVCTDNCG
jgi:hypothetical protein